MTGCWICEGDFDRGDAGQPAYACPCGQMVTRGQLNGADEVEYHRLLAAKRQWQSHGRWQEEGFEVLS